MRKNFLAHWFIVTTFVGLYLTVSIISTIHVIDFFRLSNPNWLAISLAIAFEVGAAASLAALIVLEKLNRSLVWFLFVILTLFQMMGNTYYAFVHLQDYQGWIELFGLVEEEVIYQKRILSIISGSILPLVALGFIKSLVDYLRPSVEETAPAITKVIEKIVVKEPVTEEPEVIQEPVTEEPEVIQEPVTEEPEVIQEPVTEEPEVIQEPVTEEPEVIQEPVTEEPEVIQEPVTEDGEKKNLI